jgi:hypothetical protein
MKDKADDVGVVPSCEAKSWMSKPSLRTRRSIVMTMKIAARNEAVTM